jgi:hypothetical protein
MERELGLLVPADHTWPHAEQTLGFVQERRTAGCVAKRARTDRRSAGDVVCADLARVVLQTSERALYRGRGERTTRIHVFAQTGDCRALEHGNERAGARLADQQENRVGPDVERSEAGAVHARLVTRAPDHFARV